MKDSLSIIRQCRLNFMNLLDAFSIEQLNAIPTHFSNNLLWNFGHTIVTQQLLCYHRAALEAPMPEYLLTAYRKGSSPTGLVEEAEYLLLKDWALRSLEIFESDVQRGLFRQYEVYTTSFGVEIKSLEEAVRFNATHEALHLGYALAMRKLL